MRRQAHRGAAPTEWDVKQRCCACNKVLQKGELSTPGGTPALALFLKNLSPMLLLKYTPLVCPSSFSYI